MRILAAYAVLAALACAGGTARTNSTQTRSDDVCASAEFRDAFLDGQQDVTIDGTRPSERLVVNGDRFLPCLEQVARTGGATLGIRGCAEESCRTWALWAIRLIGNHGARSFLVQYLTTEAQSNALVAAIQSVASLNEPAAKPALRQLLHHKSSEVRVRTIVALGAMKSHEDATLMLEAAKTLPEDALSTAVPGFRLLGDADTIVPLQRLADGMKDRVARERVVRELDSWRAANASLEQTLTTLRSGSGRDLIEALQKIPLPVPSSVREAALSLLQHEDPHVRAESVIAVGKSHDPSDFDLLLRTTLALPEAYVPIAARGLELLNDARAIAPLSEYAASMKNPTRKQALLGVIERMRRSAPTTNASVPARASS